MSREAGESLSLSFAEVLESIRNPKWKKKEISVSSCSHRSSIREVSVWNLSLFWKTAAHNLFKALKGPRRHHSLTPGSSFWTWKESAKKAAFQTSAAPLMSPLSHLSLLQMRNAQEQQRSERKVEDSKICRHTCGPNICLPSCRPLASADRCCCWKNAAVAGGKTTPATHKWAHLCAFNWQRLTEDGWRRHGWAQRNTCALRLSSERRCLNIQLDSRLPHLPFLLFPARVVLVWSFSPPRLVFVDPPSGFCSIVLRASCLQTLETRLGAALADLQIFMFILHLQLWWQLLFPKTSRHMC